MFQSELAEMIFITHLLGTEKRNNKEKRSIIFTQNWVYFQKIDLEYMKSSDCIDLIIIHAYII